MKATTLLALLAVTASAKTTEISELKLSTGETVRGARVIAIGEQTATISHSKGVTIASIDDVPLDVLARAHAELSEKRRQAEEFSSAIAARYTQQKEAEAREPRPLAGNAAVADIPAQLDAPATPRQLRSAHITAVASNKQQRTTTGKWNDGLRDHETHHRTTLTVTVLSDAGRGVDGACQLEAIFIGKDRLGKTSVYSKDFEELTLVRGHQTIDITNSESAADTVKHERGVFTQTKVQGGVRPYGWAVRLIQNGRILATTGSTDTMHRFFTAR